MAERTLLVAGARGLIGRAAIEHFERAAGWNAIGLSRRPADFDTRARFVTADLRDRAACASAVGELRGVTHLAYAALYEKPDLASGWLDAEHVRINLEMLRNLLEPLEAACPQLEHVTLLQGTKAYGAHLGRMRVPAKERDPRIEHANFYFAQEDWLRERQAAGAAWSLSVLRPQIVFGVAVGSPMNPVATLGAFASIQRELGEPLFCPGHPDACSEAVDAGLIAEAIEWVATTPRCAGEIYNLANGDALVWSDLFPALAAAFDMPLGEPRSLRMREDMPAHAAVWRRLMERHGLRFDLDTLIGDSWQYADMLWASERPPGVPMLVSTIKARQHGFHACRDTEDVLLEQIERMRRERLLPP